MRLRPLLFTIIIVAIPSLTAWAGASDTTSAAGVQLLETDSMGAMIFRLVLTLGAVIAVILGTVWVLRRLMTKRWPGKLKDRPIRVLDRVQLAPKRSLEVVAVGERIILLGVTENGINFLIELSPEEKSKFHPAAAEQHGFKDVLTEARGRMQQVFSRARAELPGQPVSAGAPANTS